MDSDFLDPEDVDEVFAFGLAFATLNQTFRLFAMSAMAITGFSAAPMTACRRHAASCAAKALSRRLT